MCIKIINENSEIPYNIEKPLEEQIVGCKQIVVDYEPFNQEVDKFLQEIQRFANTGIHTDISIKVVHNNYLAGFTAKKNLNRALNDIDLNEIIKLMVLAQLETDKKLKELANIFIGATK